MNVVASMEPGSLPLFLPDAFPPGERARIRRLFFGIERPFKRVLLTPIPGFFKAFEPVLPHSPAGWWPSRHGDGVIAVLVPQVTAVLDAVSVLEPATEIVFTGLAGSLGGLPPGRIVEIRRAWLGSACFERSFPGDSLFPEAENAWVHSLAHSFQTHRQLAGIADCVDMETAWIYAAARHQAKSATAILLISDRLPDQPFFQAPPFQWPEDRMLADLKPYLAT
jgi:hypothetical protein